MATISSLHCFKTMQSPNDRQFVAHYPMSSPERRNSGTVTKEKTSSRSTSPTEYAFIMNTGRKSPAAARQDLREVRSHVMKVHLRRQQQKGRDSGESFLSAGSDRRKGKHRARSSRSNSRETEELLNAPFSEGSSVQRLGIGMVFLGFSTLTLLQLGQIGYGTGEAEALGRYHDQQRFALDFNWSPNPLDDVSVSAESYVASSICDRIQGNLEPSLETLNKKSDAVRIVMDTLRTHENHVPPSIVMAVSLLAVGCAMENEVDQVQHHLQALERIVGALGGMETLDLSLQRICIWNVHSVAVALQLPPIFACPTSNQMEPLPLAFLDDARIRAWRTVKRLPKDSSFLFDTMLRLHQIGLATSSDWSDEVDPRALSNLYFEGLQNVAALQVDEPWNQMVGAGSQARETALMYKVFTIGMALFTFGSIRHARSQLGLPCVRYTCCPIYIRLRMLLEGPGKYHAWPRGKSLEPVLATLMYGAESCDYHDPWRPWFMDALRTAIDMSKTKSLDEFRKTLKSYPSTDGYKAAEVELWREVVGGTRMSGTPNLVFSGTQ